MTNPELYAHTYWSGKGKFQEIQFKINKLVPLWKEDADSVAEAMTKGEAYARLFLPTKKVEKII